LQEELVHLQQQLDTSRQQRGKLEHERDQVLSEKQSYYKETQRLQVNPHLLATSMEEQRI
jgi:hypothetical protein